MLFAETLVLVRGAGDLATGAIYRLHQAGFPLIAAETPQPLAVRRTVAFAQAVYAGAHTVEGMTAVRVDDPAAALAMACRGDLPILPDPRDEVIPLLRPVVLVDARLLKRADAPVATGRPRSSSAWGLRAGRNCHAAIETKQGASSGQVYWQGRPKKPIRAFGRDRRFRAGAIATHPSPASGGPWSKFGERVGRGRWWGTSRRMRQPGVGISSGWHRPRPVASRPGGMVEPGVKLGDIDPPTRMLSTPSARQIARHWRHHPGGGAGIG
ncbi:MAG: hypothetical protein KIS63_01230 [Caldilineales bacterium]|nr:hypothetical protein [Caldilineales bacterium]